MGDRTKIADALDKFDHCTGGWVCPAVAHFHGCHCDDGNCDRPAEHTAVPLRADPDTSDELAAEARRLLDAYPEDVFESPPQDWKAGMVTGTVPDAVDEDGYLDVWITPDAFAAHVLRKIALPVIAALLERAVTAEARFTAPSNLTDELAGAELWSAALRSNVDNGVTRGYSVESNTELADLLDRLRRLPGEMTLKSFTAYEYNEAVARTVAMSHIAAERDAERAGRERAEAEARQLREAIGDPKKLRLTAMSVRSVSRSASLHLHRIADAAAVAEGAEDR